MNVFILLFSVFVLTACSASQNEAITAVQEKAAVTTLTGTITKAGEKFVINTTTQGIKEIDSYTVQFDQHVGKKVTVTGQYSGTTLFVDSVQE